MSLAPEVEDVGVAASEWTDLMQNLCNGVEKLSWPHCFWKDIDCLCIVCTRCVQYLVR